MADRERQPGETATNGLLPPLGVFGFGALEPVVVAARHYNASLLSFDDLVGFPMPDASGGIRYVPTAASIQGAEAAFLDEISRARPEVQNKLFSIIHERLDLALNDRFAFVCTVPSWVDLSASEQEGVLLRASAGVSAKAAEALKRAVAEARLRISLHRRAWGERSAPAAPKSVPAKRRPATTPLERVVQLAREGDGARFEISAAVGEALCLLPPGGRHALAFTRFEAGLAERLDGTVAEAWAKVFAQ